MTNQSFNNFFAGGSAVTHASLFSGIGGFDLAAEWMGWTNVFSCEKDDKANRVLQKQFPNVTHHRDIFKLDGTQYQGQIDILTGGFPCQPFSLAGKRKGESDDRYLWPEMYRIIREIKPTYVVGENVYGLVNMEDGSTLETIYTDLESEGYKVESFIIPACAVQAWHRRDRIWIIAYTYDSNERRTSRRFPQEDGQGRLQQQQVVQSRSASKAWVYSNATRSNESRECNERQREGEYRGLGSKQDDTNTNGKRSQKQGQPRGSVYQEQDSKGKVNRAYNDCIWATEPNVGRVADGVPGRVDRLKQLGNAIVPQVAYEIFKVIEKAEAGKKEIIKTQQPTTSI